MTLDPKERAERRARLAAPRPTVDAQGRPTGPRLRYRYNSLGILEAVEVDDDAPKTA